MIIFVHVSNFCLDRPFGFVHQDAHFFLSRLFGFATYRAFWFFLIFWFDWFLTKYFLTSPACGLVSICSHMSYCTLVLIVRHPLAPRVWLGMWGPFFSTRFLEIHWDEPSCWKFVLTSLDIVVQGRHVFQFNQAWIPAELLLAGPWLPREAWPIMLHTEGRRGLPQLKCALEVWW